MPGAVARTWQAGHRLDLSRADIAFLAGIRALLHHSEDAALDDGQLREVFAVVDELAQGDPDSRAARGTRSMARLHTQRLLAQIGGGTFSDTGLYALTGFGKVLADYYAGQDALDRRSLLVLANRLRADLAEVLQRARRGGDDAHWDDLVAQLRLTVADLVEGIDRRAHGLDDQQAEIRTEIAALLEADWVDSIPRCEALLAETGDRLVELHGLLIEQTSALQQLLLEIRDAAVDAGRPLADQAARVVLHQVERLDTWGEARFASWKRYFEDVHDFIQRVVRVDPSRAVAERLRDAVADYFDAPWSLTVTRQPRYLHLRAPDPSEAQARAARPTEDRAPHLEASAPDLAGELDPEALVAAALRTGGRARLVALLRAHLPGLDPDQADRLAGDLVEALALAGQPTPLRELRWTAVGAGSVQDLVVEGPRG